MSLHQAARRGDLVAITLLLKSAPDLKETKGKKKLIALHEAAKKGHVAVAEALIVAGAPVNARDSEGATPLFLASEQPAMITLLLTHGADPDIPTTSGWRLSFKLAWECKLDLLEALHRAGADLNATGQGFSTLHAAAYSGKVASIEWLLAKQVPVDLRADNHQTALHVAARRGHLGAVAALLKGGADPSAKDTFNQMPAKNIGGRSAKKIRVLLGDTVSPAEKLMAAVESGDIAGVKAALKAGADIKHNLTESPYDDTPLTLAVKKKNQAMIDALLAVGASIDEVGVRGGQPLRVAINERNADLVRFLLDRGARLDVVDKDNNHPFSQLTEAEDCALLGVLLEAGANINARHQFGGTLLTESRSLEMIDFLIAHGADVNAPSDDARTPLHDAAINDRPEKARRLLAAGADPDPVNTYGGSALLEAAERNNLKVLPILLAAGADRSRPNNQGKTGQMLAEERGYTLVVEMLSGAAPKPVFNTENQEAFWAACEDWQTTAEQLTALLSAPGVDINARNSDQRTALHLVLWHSREALVAPLLTAGADLYILNKDGNPPMWSVCGPSNTTSALQLLDAGFDVKFKAADGSTVLHAAASRDNAALVKELLRRGAAIDKKDRWNRSPLMEALGGRSKAALVLIRAGADLTQRGDEGRTALLLAAKDCTLPVVKALIKKGADVHEIPEGVKGLGPACAVALALHENRIPVARALHAAGASLTRQMPSGESAIHFLAFRRGNIKNIGWLLDNGCSVDLKDRSGRTAMHQAAWASWGAEENLTLLIGRGGDVHIADGKGHTPLHKAAGDGNETAIRVLLAAGAKVDVVDAEGQTPLHATVTWRAQMESAKMLLAAGADPAVKDAAGLTVTDALKARKATEDEDRGFTELIGIIAARV
ncbi:MAG: ankyrin repeat protein [Myxococcota bacterium]|jgi:ankyrin repeat protein